MGAIIICDLAFGDSGKGSWTDFWVRQTEAGLVVRFNGGAQAAHTVVLPDGRQHTFSQFGSASFVSGVQTLLSKYVLVNPLKLAHEAAELQDLGVRNPYQNLLLDERALITTPYQMATNRLQEHIRGRNRHGSCGLGIGQTMIDALANPDQVLRCGDLLNSTLTVKKLAWHREVVLQQLAELIPRLNQEQLPPDVEWALRALFNQVEQDEIQQFFIEAARSLQILKESETNKLLRNTANIVFEGAQGVLLDEWRGFHPNTTWSTTTPTNAKALLQEAGYQGEVDSYGLIRAYATRHGAGPFPTESVELEESIEEPDNPTNPWQGEFRVGWLDLPILRYAVEVAQVDQLLISALDLLPEKPKVAGGYQLEGAAYQLQIGEFQDLTHQERLNEDLKMVKVQYQEAPSDPMAYAEYVAHELQVPLAGVSFGKTHLDKVLVSIPAQVLSRLMQ